jgi:colicin import membrane protein
LERQREAEREARRAAEAAARREAERQAEQEARLAAERQAQRQAELERQREELRRIREAEQAEARRRAQAEREAVAARERQMLEALQAEEGRVSGAAGQSGVLSSARPSAATQAQIASRWVPLITSRVRQYWVRPQAASLDLRTIVTLRLDPGGAVIPNSVRVVEGSGQAGFDQSVVAAIYRASPLPVPDGDEFELFRDFNFVFRP